MSTLTEYEQFVYDWQYGRLGDTSFKGYLAKAIAKSDLQNRDRLRKSFPGEVEAIHSFQTVKGYWGSIISRVTS